MMNWKPSPADAGRRGLLQGLVGTLVVSMAPLRAARPAASAAPQDPRYQWVSTLAELVIPATDSPSAAQPDVIAFVLLAFDSRMSDLEPAMLTRVRQALDAATPGGFINAHPAARQSVLATLDRQSYAAAAPPGSIAHDWQRTKAAIAAAYYTSPAGATQELVYEPVPGGFRNIVLTPDFKCRSNEGFNSGFGGAL